MTVTAPVLATNCYVVGADDSTRCVVIDPGIGVVDTLRDTLRAQRRVPEAVLITHGHVDHTFDAGRIQREFDVPVYVHEADRYRLDDPFGTIGPQLAPMLAPLRDTWVAIGPVVTLTDGSVVDLAGVTFTALSMPGHTEGSTFYVVDDPASDAAAPRSVFTGDVLLAGTIGRTDLLGGDDATMQRTLGLIADPDHGVLADSAAVLPGHGPASTVGAERATNPFLRTAAAR